MQGFFEFHKKPQKFFHLCLVTHNWQTEADEDLVKHYASTGNMQVLGILFKRHSLLCFTVCMKYLKDEMSAEDAVMQVFEKLLTDLRKHEVQNFRSWLHSVCRNHCLMHLRKPQLFAALQTDIEENEEIFVESASFVHPTDDKQVLEEKLQTMEQVLTELNAAQASCLRLFYLEGKSYEDISTQLGLTLNEVKSHLQNGKRNLKIGMARKGITYASILFLWMQQSA
jgi:RNA polymerase sigma-70 factor (ECF subfamily)